MRCLRIVQDFLSLLEHDFCSQRWGCCAENHINFLQRQTFCLRQAEIDKRYRERNATREEEIRAVPDVGDHVGHGTCNDEVEEPMDRRANRDAQRTNAQREDLRAIDPRDAGVRKAESDREDVDERYGCVTSGGQGAALGGAGDFDVCSNEPHGDKHYGGTAHEHVSSSEAVDDKVHGDDDADQANDAVDTSGVQLGG